MPLRTITDAPDEALPLINDTSEWRTYQAYCESVVDSSSPPRSSGLSFSESIPRSRKPSLQLTLDPQPSRSLAIEHNASPVLSAASSPQRYSGSATLLKTGKETKRQTVFSNRRALPRNTTTGKVNHITRAVTPRGSHSLARFKVTAYDRPPSHPRMQRMESSNSPTARTIPRKPLQQSSQYAETGYRPRPLLPLRASAVQDGTQLHHETQNEPLLELSQSQHYAQAAQRGREKDYTSGEESPPPPEHNEHFIFRRPLPSLPYDCSEASQPKQSDTFKEEDSLYTALTSLPRLTYIRSPSRSPCNHSLNDPTQLRSSADLYEPRGLLPELEEETRARRTELKETSLKYQFGEYPPRDADLLPPKPSRRDIFRPQTEYFLNADSDPTRASAPAPSILSSTDVQNGPRPPPWGSYKDLEMQRLQRGDRREVEHLRRHRLTPDSMSTLQKDHSTESLGLKPSIVVAQLAQQIEKEFPEGLGVQSARGGIDWYRCCNVM
jgi:hypothetical protein